MAAGLTLSDAETHLAAWLQASLDVAQRGQSYTIKDRALTRADTKEIQNQIEFWDRAAKRLSRGGIRVGGITPTR